MDELFSEATYNTQIISQTFLFLVSNWSSALHLYICASAHISDLIYIIIFLVPRVSFRFCNLPLSLWLSFLSMLLLYWWFIGWALSSSEMQTPSYLTHFFTNCHALIFSRLVIINFIITRWRVKEYFIYAEYQVTTKQHFKMTRDFFFF